MKLRISTIGMFLISFLLGFGGLGLENVYADDLVLIGNDSGIEITSANPGDIKKLFDVANMTPGDKVNATLTVRNTYEYPFLLSVEVKNVHDPDSGIDLAEALIIRILKDGNELTSFPATSGAYSFPDSFAPGSVTNLVFEVELPGETTGNKYQDTNASLRWFFTAVSTRPDEPPDDPEPTPGPDPTPGPERTPGPTSTPPPIEDNRIDIVDGDTTGSVDSFTDEDPLGEPPTDYGVEIEEIIDDEISLGTKEMPKTGEAPLWHSMSVGMLMIVAGLRLGKKRKSEKLV